MKLNELIKLTPEQLVRALLILAISTIFPLYIIEKGKTEKYSNKQIAIDDVRRINDIKRNDSIYLVIQNIKDTCSTEFKRYLLQDISKIEKSINRTEKAIIVNKKLINKIRR